LPKTNSIGGGDDVVARARSPNRDKAFEMWKSSNGDMLLKDIAAELNVSDSQIRKWKNQDNWDDQLKGNITISKSNVTNKAGAPKGNQNAIGNRGGSAPKGNDNAVSHGFFRRIFPDDEETHSIIDEIGVKSPIDILWENIVIQYTAIARAQKVMFVESRDEMIKELKKEKTEMDLDKDKDGNIESFPTYIEKEYEFQFAWDRHATFLKAQSRAMSTLQSLIKQYEEMCMKGLATEEQRLRIEKLKLEIDKIKAGEGDNDEDLIEDWVNAVVGDEDEE
jgi:phage terminase small subunit